MPVWMSLKCPLQSSILCWWQKRSGKVDQVTTWLTGYTAGDIARLEQSTVSYGDFFLNAPVLKPNRTIQHPVNGGGAPLRFSGDRLDAVRFQILFIFRTPFPWM